jgi:hypothetical protein
MLTKKYAYHNSGNVTNKINKKKNKLLTLKQIYCLRFMRKLSNKKTQHYNAWINKLELTNFPTE